MIDGRIKSQQDARYLAAARQHGAMIERLARGYEADGERRRDLVQEIHAALWRSFATFEASVPNGARFIEARIMSASRI